MSTIVTRSGKGSPLTHAELDDNFTNLNTDKYQEGSAIGAVTPAAGTFTTLTATGQTSLGGTPDSESLRVLNVASAVNYLTARGATSGSAVTLGAAGLNGGIATILQSKGSGTVEFWTNGGNQRQMAVSHTASAVNYVQVTGAATTGSPSISAQGSDTYIGLAVQAKSATLALGTRVGGNPSLQLLDSGSSPANYFRIVGSATTFSPVLSAQGSDTNISQVFQSKGTGAIDLAAGSSGVNISNGGTVTAITRTAAGSGYTSTPSATVTAPTTAGGVQAVIQPVMQITASFSVAVGGTGYTVGDVLTASGGTSTSAVRFTVATLSGSAVATVTLTDFGQYTVLPATASPLTMTGGTGSGCTVNVVWAVSTFTITNAGSGYVEQPTVTFSGGGGSGAAAFARIGSDVTAKGLGANFDLAVSNGIGFRVSDTGGTSANYLQAINQVAGNGPRLRVEGSDTNVNLVLSTKGTGSMLFFTNTEANRQFQIAHTASAVNYVQVTGAATGGHPTISSQGSDSNARLVLNAKGSSSGIDLLMNNARQMFIGTNGSAVNYFQTGGTASGIGLALQAQGSDTNISQVFQSKGTGAIDLAAGSSGVNISNGGTVTAITRTAIGGSYTSAPAMALTAPTTAGGVQATATCVLIPTNNPSIVSGGTGYTVGDVLTFVGGTGTAQQMTVTTVSGGVITAASSANTPAYTVAPTNPVSVTGGTGSGATFSVASWCVGAITITNAGSGYVEQPTVSFSGGGGSGAAAYATVGSGTTIRGLGNQINFVTPQGSNAFQIIDSGVASPAYMQFGGATGNAINYVFGGTTANAGLYSVTKGTGSHVFTTNGSTSTSQFQVAHTASAVNYVQVTGAATGNAPALSAQGSDTSMNFTIAAKGSGSVSLPVNRANYLTLAGTASTGGNTSISAVGSDTNIDLTLTTKGTGSVNLNTGGGTQFKVIDNAGATQFITAAGSSTGNVAFSASGSGSAGFSYVALNGSNHRFWSSGSTEQMRISHTASAVNYVQVTGAATGGFPAISAQGSDTNVTLRYNGKGSGGHLFYDGNGAAQFRILPVTSTANYLQVTSSIAGAAPFLSSQGTDTNIDLTLTPKGTGLVRFGTYTAGAPAATGYISIKAADGTTYKVLVGT